MKRGRILIVEDELDLLDLLDSTLTREGFATAGSLNGMDAMHRIKEFKPDLIVLDLMMPSMNGWQFCRWLRANKESTIRSVPVIMISAKGTPVDKDAGLSLGADDYLVKPFHISELVLRIDKILKRCKRDRNLTPPS